MLYRLIICKTTRYHKLKLSLWSVKLSLSLSYALKLNKVVLWRLVSKVLGFCCQDFVIKWARFFQSIFNFKFFTKKKRLFWYNINLKLNSFIVKIKKNSLKKIAVESRFSISVNALVNTIIFNKNRIQKKLKYQTIFDFRRTFLSFYIKNNFYKLSNWHWNIHTNSEQSLFYTIINGLVHRMLVILFRPEP